MRPRYVPVRFLAAGGVAEVILARQIVDSGIERTVVVKQVLRHLAGEREFVEMFRSEMRLAVQLRHPNIVQVLDAGDNEGVPFLAMEALFGADLRSVLREASDRSERVPLEATLSIVADVARGLHYAHTLVGADGRPLGVVHRDISPHNIFITRDGTAKILDFGIAKSAAQMNATSTGITKGKPGYMAPEQIRGDTLDARTDVYALGVVLWEALVCKRLWKRETDVAAAMAVLSTDAAPPSAIVPDVPPELDALVGAMLARDPARRPINADAVAHALERINASRGCTAPHAAVVATMREMFPEKTDEFDASATVPAMGDFGASDPGDGAIGSATASPPSLPVTRLSREIASPRDRSRPGILVASGLAVAVVAFASAMWVTKALRHPSTASATRPAPVAVAATTPAPAPPPVLPAAQPAEPTPPAPAIATPETHAIEVDAGASETPRTAPDEPHRRADRTRRGHHVLPVGAMFRE